MRLFTVDENYQLELHKEWIHLIPEFSELIRRDKGSKGDYRGDKKLKARRELAFIYFDLDFTSPIRDLEDFERREEAMRYTGLTEADIDAAVMAAHSRYELMLLDAAPSLKTLRAVKKAMSSLNLYFETINFSEKNNKQELVNDPLSFLKNLKEINNAYAAVETFEKRIYEELKKEGSIRGQSTMGGKEGKRTTWEEGSTERPVVPQTSFAEIGKALKEANTLMGKDEEEVEE